MHVGVGVGVGGRREAGLGVGDLEDGLDGIGRGREDFGEEGEEG